MESVSQEPWERSFLRFIFNVAVIWKNFVILNHAIFLLHTILVRPWLNIFDFFIESTFYHILYSPCAFSSNKIYLRFFWQSVSGCLWCFSDDKWDHLSVVVLIDYARSEWDDRFFYLWKYEMEHYSFLLADWYPRKIKTWCGWHVCLLLTVSELERRALEVIGWV